MTDIALISLATTPGLVRSDAAFSQLVRDCGATCEVVPVKIGPEGKLRRHAAVTDLVEAIAARRSAANVRARAIVYSTTTAALLQHPPAPYAVRIDATAALNRPPGWPSAWQRWRERDVLRRARVIVPVSDAAAAALPDPHAPVVRLPIPLDGVPPGAAHRDIEATAYAGYPRKRGLELICRAWQQVRPPDGRLLVGGTDRDKALRWLDRCGVPEPDGVEWLGMVSRDEWLRTVGRSRAFVNASRHEDFGIAQFEALAAGTPVVTVPTPGQFEALPLLRQLAPELVTGTIDADELATALRTALAWEDAKRSAYASSAAGLIAPYRPDALRSVMADQILPALGITP